jgi:hypothetical protein
MARKEALPDFDGDGHAAGQQNARNGEKGDSHPAGHGAGSDERTRCPMPATIVSNSFSPSGSMLVSQQS